MNKRMPLIFVGPEGRLRVSASWRLSCARVHVTYPLGSHGAGLPASYRILARQETTCHKAMMTSARVQIRRKTLARRRRWVAGEVHRWP